MFDFDVGKLLIFGIVALAVIPPKDLPRVMRVVGQALGRMRRMAAEFQGQFMDAMREADLDSVKKELESVKSDFANVRKELDTIEQSAKIDSSFDPTMAMHSEQSHAIGAPKEVGLSEVSLSGPAPAAAQPAAEGSATAVAVEPAGEATAPVSPPPPAAEPEAAAPPRDAAE
jgi:sec-independent protein translocase protein TatB